VEKNYYLQFCLQDTYVFKINFNYQFLLTNFKLYNIKSIPLENTFKYDPMTYFLYYISYFLLVKIVG
jgi:hypothetical protein